MGLRFDTSDVDFAIRIAGPIKVKMVGTARVQTGRMNWHTANVQNPCGEIALSAGSELTMLKHRTHDDQIDAMRYALMDADFARKLYEKLRE